MSTGKGTQTRNRWAGRPDPRPSPRAPPNEDDLAMAALLGEATARARSEEEEKERERRRGRAGGGPKNNDQHRRNQHRSQQRHPGGDDPRYDRYGRGGGNKRIVEDEDEDGRPPGRGDYSESGGGGKRRRRWNDRGEETSRGEGSSSSPVEAEDDAAAVKNDANKAKADFGLSGALAGDAQTGNVYNGVTLKFSEPPEARVPNTRWRLYVFRKKKTPSNGGANDDDGDGLIDTYHISRQSAYLFGRERKVADVPVDHPSLSKQHAVLQYRALPSKKEQRIGAPTKIQCKPYLMDLESTNGTFVNGARLDSARYYELRRGDVITLGASSREYVLLTEQSAKSGI